MKETHINKRSNQVSIQWQISLYDSESLIKWPPKFKSVTLMHGDKARQAIAAGINVLSKTGQVTLGPGGRNVALEYEAGDPKITKDGVTVLKSIWL